MALNRLADSKNPYLLQHAENPVHWYPWCDEAFEKAASEDKPIFLSVGYSTCHWCHVMSEESFDDPEVAQALNDGYISIKVDREERPDIDSVYQEACQATTGQGGWPLTIIMDTDKRPFFAGTYLPKVRKYGRPGLLDILKKVGDMWRDNRQQLTQAGEMITQLLKESGTRWNTTSFNNDEITHAYSVLKTEFDNNYGGFGYAPKFPMPVNILFLLRYYRQIKDEEALNMVEKTLVMMRRGGIYDQIGFGFHRYSTDHKWLVPHFEKMLYDNALLAVAYLETFQITQKPFYADTAREVLTYLLRDMQAPDGGFASAEDADSEGGEGRFYIWSRDEVCEVLHNQEADLFTRYFDITRKGNFEAGTNIPNLLSSKAGLLKIAGGEEEEPMVNEALSRLFKARARRPRPFRDEKVITSWNGLAITAMAKAGRILGEQKYIDAAGDTAAFILKNLCDSDGRLLTAYFRGQAVTPAYLHDYAFLIQGLLELWEAKFDEKYIQSAVDLMERQINLFWDKEDGGFYFTSYDAHELPVRRMDATDGAIPSGNSVSVQNLVRLSRLTGREEWEGIARELLQSFSGNVSRHPSGYTTLLSEWLLLEVPPIEIVIAGDPEKPGTKRLLEVVNSVFLPEAIVFNNPGGARGRELAAILPPILDKEPVSNGALAYVCQGLACLEPIESPDALRSTLNPMDTITTPTI
jgi:uncharacterized protein YyaL (SSP411 family)